MAAQTHVPRLHDQRKLTQVVMLIQVFVAVAVHSPSLSPMPAAGAAVVVVAAAVAAAVAESSQHPARWMPEAG